MLRAAVDQCLDSRFALRRDDRSHLNIFVEAIADAQRSRSFSNGIAKGLLRFPNGHGDRYGETALAGATESAIADDLCGHLHIGIG